MSKASRDKGRRGQTMAEKVLRDRDWNTDPLTAGVKREDIIATDPDGDIWSVEVKNCYDIKLAHKGQAQEQAKQRGYKWMLMSKIPFTSSWLIQRQGHRPVVWHQTNAETVEG